MGAKKLPRARAEEDPRVVIIASLIRAPSLNHMTPQEQRVVQKEKALAWLRAGFAVVAIIVVQLNPSRVAHYPVLSGLSLWSFFIYSAFVVYVTREEKAGSEKIGLTTTCLDLVWISLIVFSTGGTRTPFFIYYSFPVITASSRWGITRSILVAIVSDALYGAIRFTPIAETTDSPLAIDTFLVRSIYLVVLACIFGVLSEFEKKQSQKLLALSKTAAEVAALDERRRISRELHDGLLQTLATHLLRLEICRKHLLHSPKELDCELHSVEEQTRGSMKVIRNFLAGKDVQVFPPGMLLDQLRDDLRFLRDGLGLNVFLETTPEDLTIPEPTESVLYYVLREGLMNIIRHSHASRAGVLLKQTKNYVSGCLSDDGIGFSTAKAEKNGHGMGLPSMTERIKSLGGELDIQSSPGKGTRISFILPLLDPESHNESPQTTEAAQARRLP